MRRRCNFLTPATYLSLGFGCVRHQLTKTSARKILGCYEKLALKNAFIAEKGKSTVSFFLSLFKLVSVSGTYESNLVYELEVSVIRSVG